MSDRIVIDGWVLIDQFHTNCYAHRIEYLELWRGVRCTAERGGDRLVFERAKASRTGGAKEDRQ
jgi:hypothetical protein